MVIKRFSIAAVPQILMASPMSLVMSLALIITLILALAPTEASAMCVGSDYANLRRGPSTKYEKTWEVLRYTPLKKLSKKGKWYRVKDLEGDVHWVYAPLVTEKYKCAMIKDEKANIRTGPGTNYKKTPESPGKQYYSYKVLKIKGDWVKVTDEFGTNGWIFKKLLWIQ